MVLGCESENAPQKDSEREEKMNDKSCTVVLDEQDLDIIVAETKPSDFPVSKGNFPVSK